MEKKELTLKESKLYRLILRVAFALISFVAPMIVIGTKFNIFTKSSVEKWSIAGITLLLVVGWRFKKKLQEWINSWENQNIFKHVLIGFGRVWPFVLVVALLVVIHFSAHQLINDILFCLEWTCALECVAYLVLYPMEMKMDYNVKRMIRKQERVEDYQDAIKEGE